MLYAKLSSRFLSIAHYFFFERIKYMCVGCLVISAFTFIVPVSDAPASSVPHTVTGSATSTLAIAQQSAQQSAGIATVEQEIQAVLAQLPDSKDSELLQDGLESTLIRLDTATSDQQAQAIIDEEVNKLAEALAKAPNADQVANILLDIRDPSATDSFQNVPSSVELQSSADSVLPTGLQLNQRSGWLS